MSMRESVPKPLTAYQKATLRRVRRQGLLPVRRPVFRAGRHTLLGRGYLRDRRGSKTVQAGYLLTDEGRKVADGL